MPDTAEALHLALQYALRQEHYATAAGLCDLLKALVSPAARAVLEEQANDYKVRAAVAGLSRQAS